MTLPNPTKNTGKQTMPEGKSEIPAEIMSAAEKAFKYGFGLRYEVAIKAIAEAILAERQRCAEAAEEYSCKLAAYPNQEAFNYYENGVLDASVGIKWLILNPSKAKTSGDLND